MEVQSGANYIFASPPAVVFHNLNPCKRRFVVLVYNTYTTHKILRCK